MLTSRQSIIKGWLDPVVASKIHFTKTVEEVEEFIERGRIIKELGGNEDWVFQYVEPVAGEDAALADVARLAALQTERDAIVKELESVTREWISAVGSKESDEKRQRRLELAGKLEQGYWKMDKHVRGRTVYDRTGVLGQEGALKFYPEKKAQPQTSADDID